METNDLATLWIVLKNLRDNAHDPHLITAIDLAMLAIADERTALLSDDDDTG